MVNENIQGVIPLAGLGYQNKPNGSFDPGEYKQFLNVEINDDEEIVSRRPMFAGRWNAAYPNTLDFVGDTGLYVFYLSSFDRVCGTDLLSKQWFVSCADLGLAGDKYGIKKVFYYNKRLYLMVSQYVAGTNSFNYILLSAAFFPSDDITLLTGGSFTNHGTIIGNIPVSSINIVGLDPFIDLFVYKDRVWIQTESQLYFSKATDPITWTVPDGGFFRIVDSLVKEVKVTNDAIYILTNTSIQVLTYSSDPNADASLRPVTVDIGVEAAVEHKGVLYALLDDSLYSLSSNNLTFVRDLGIRLPSNNVRLVSFGNYIIIHYYNKVASSIPAGAYTIVYPDVSDIYVLNTNNGSISRIELSLPNTSLRVGYAYTRDTDMFLVFAVRGNTTGSLVYMRMDYTSYTSYPFKDSIRNNTGLVFVAPEVAIEIDSYVPDGSEHLIKKFRNMLLEIKAPDDQFTVAMGYGNEVYGAGVKIMTPAPGRPPYPVRVGLNQRARSISLLFKSVAANSLLPGDFADRKLMIKDIRVLWSYTARARS